MQDFSRVSLKGSQETVEYRKDPSVDGDLGYAAKVLE